jgi:hypothetical protein
MNCLLCAKLVARCAVYSHKLTASTHRTRQSNVQVFEVRVASQYSPCLRRCDSAITTTATTAVAIASSVVDAAATSAAATACCSDIDCVLCTSHVTTHTHNLLYTKIAHVALGCVTIASCRVLTRVLAAYLL